jgi:hypothetical protein
MKNRMFLFSIFMISVLFFANSCKKSSTFTVIPADAKVVGVFDAKSLYSKAEISKIGEYSFYNTAMQEIENESKQVAEMLEELLKNPTSTGINLLQDIIIYYYDNDDDEQFVAVALPLISKSKYEKWLEKLLTVTGENISFETNKDYTFFKIDNNVAFGWNKKVAIVLIPTNGSSEDNLDENLENVMTLEKDDQITTNKNFNSFFSNKKDISVWIDFSLFKDDVKNYEQMLGNTNLNISETSLSAYIDFQDGNINMNVNYEMGDNENVTKIYDGKFDENVLKYSPNKTLGLYAIAINTPAFADFLVEMDALKEYDGEIKKELGYSIDEIIESFNGSFLLNLYGLESKEVEYEDYEMIWNDKINDYDYVTVTKTKETLIPNGLISFGLKNSTIISTIFSSLGEKMGLSKEGDYYFVTDKDLTYYFGYNSNVFVMTTDKNVITSLSKGLSENLSSTKQGEAIKKYNQYGYLSLNLDDYPTEILSEFDLSDKKEEFFVSIMKETFEYVEFKYNNKSSADIDVSLKNKDKNSLVVMMETIDNVVKKFL